MEEADAAPKDEATLAAVGQALAVAGSMIGAHAEAAEAGEIIVCPNSFESIQDDFIITARGEIDLKGFGTQPLYTLEGEVRKDR